MNNVSLSAAKFSKKNPTSPKISSPVLKAIHVPSLNIKIKTPQIKEGINIPKRKNFELDHRFKIQKTFIEERARSTSPKLRGESKINQTFIEDNELVKKYKKIRLENQEFQIKIKELYCDLMKKYSQGTNLENCVETSIQIMALVFQCCFN